MDYSNSEEVMVAVLYREKPSGAWEFCSYAVNAEVGWQLAAAIQQQERVALGRARAQAIVVRRTDYDRDIIKRYDPPAGWKPALIPDSEVKTAPKKEAPQNDSGPQVGGRPDQHAPAVGGQGT